MDFEKQVEDARAEFRRQSEKLRKCPNLAQGGAGVENAYGQAYLALVRLGVEMPLKRKYRG